MEKAALISAVACFIALSVTFLAWGSGNQAVALSEKQIPAGHSIVYVAGKEAEPPLWPENAERPKRPVAAQEALQSMQMASAEQPPLVKSGPPLRRLTKNSITVGKKPTGETVMIVWNR